MVYCMVYQTSHLHAVYNILHSCMRQVEDQSPYWTMHQWQTQKKIQAGLIYLKVMYGYTLQDSWHAATVAHLNILVCMPHWRADKCTVLAFLGIHTNIWTLPFRKWTCHASAYNKVPTLCTTNVEVFACVFVREMKLCIPVHRSMRLQQPSWAIAAICIQLLFKHEQLRSTGCQHCHTVQELCTYAEGTTVYCRPEIESYSGCMEC